MANRSRNRRRAASYAASSKARKRSPIKEPHTIINSAKGRLDHGPPIAVIDIGSNSVRLVIYEGLTRSPTPIFNEKVLAGLGRQVQSTGLLARRRDRHRARGAQALPRAVRHPARAQDLGDRHRRLPRRAQRPRLHRRSRAHLPHADHDPVGQARGPSHRARHRLRHPQAGRHRRRSRRRLARTGRRARHARARRRDAAARRPGAAGHRRQIAQEGGEDRRGSVRGPRHAARWRGPHLLRGRRHLARAGAAAHVADRLSVPRHAQLPHLGARGAGVLAAGAPGRYRDAVQDRSRQCRPPAAARLRRAGDGKPGAHDQAEAGDHLRARRARRACSIRCSSRASARAIR